MVLLKLLEGLFSDGCIRCRHFAVKSCFYYRLTSSPLFRLRRAAIFILLSRIFGQSLRETLVFIKLQSVGVAGSSSLAAFPVNMDRPIARG